MKKHPEVPFAVSTDINIPISYAPYKCIWLGSRSIDKPSCDDVDLILLAGVLRLKGFALCYDKLRGDDYVQWFISPVAHLRDQSNGFMFSDHTHWCSSPEQAYRFFLKWERYERS